MQVNVKLPVLYSCKFCRMMFCRSALPLVLFKKDMILLSRSQETVKVCLFLLVEYDMWRLSMFHEGVLLPN